MRWYFSNFKNNINFLVNIIKLVFILNIVVIIVFVFLVSVQKIKFNQQWKSNTTYVFPDRFTPDFTSSWVIRELTLVTAADLEFHFTLNVTLPHHLLPLCADVVPGPSWEESFWRLTVLFVR